MIPLKELITIDPTSNTAVYLQITNSIIHNIRAGRLRRGLQLPGSRDLADMLQVHRNTLLVAYEELQAQGWIETIPRKGTFVTRNLPDIQPEEIEQGQTVGHYPGQTLFPINEKSIASFPASHVPDADILVIDDGFPDIRLAPMELYTRELRSLSRRHTFSKYYKYGDSRGTAYLRETLSSFLNDTRGLPVSPDNIMITNGAQMGIYLASRLLIKPYDDIIIGEPGFFGATLALQQTGATINRVPVDDYGIDVNAVEALCKEKEIRLLYVIPHHHHPTTVTLIPERRVRLLELAAHYKFAIIEDDYDYNFHYASNPVLPMASLDHHGNVIYIGTLSKTLIPSVRMGFIVAPVNFIQAASNIRRTIDWQGDSMKEVAIAELYRNGTMERHVKKIVALYRKRRDYFCELLKGRLGELVSFKTPDGGMSVWARFHDADLSQVEKKALTMGLKINNGRMYNTGTEYNTTRLGFASLNTEEQEKAIDILSKAI